MHRTTEIPWYNNVLLDQGGDSISTQVDWMNRCNLYCEEFGISEPAVLIINIETKSTESILCWEFVSETHNNQQFVCSAPLAPPWLRQWPSVDISYDLQSYFIGTIIISIYCNNLILGNYFCVNFKSHHKNIFLYGKKNKIIHKS